MATAGAGVIQVGPRCEARLRRIRNKETPSGSPATRRPRSEGRGACRGEATPVMAPASLFRYFRSSCVPGHKLGPSGCRVPGEGTKGLRMTPSAVCSPPQQPFSALTGGRREPSWHGRRSYRSAASVLGGIGPQQSRRNVGTAGCWHAALSLGSMTPTVARMAARHSRGPNASTAWKGAEVRDAQDRQDGPEDLFPVNVHLGGDVVNDRGPDEERAASPLEVKMAVPSAPSRSTRLPEHPEGCGGVDLSPAGPE